MASKRQDLISSTTSSLPALTGSCKCGAIQYSSTVLPSYFTNCHCLTCRKASGSAYITFGEFPTSALTFTSSNPQALRETRSDIAIRQHCTDCGSPMSMQYLCEMECVHVTAGTIDGESVKGEFLGVRSAIFVSERKDGKERWFDVGGEEDIPRYEGFSGGMQRKIDAWKEASREVKTE